MTKRKVTETRREVELLSFSHGDDNDKEEENRVPFLSEYEIFNILSLCSAEFLHNKGKLVCKSWATTLYSQFFIKKHLSLSNPTTRLYFRHTPNFIYEQEYEDLDVMWDSSSGLRLYDDQKNETLFLKNSITNQISNIPDPPLPFDDSLSKLNVVYLPLTGQVKVIHNSRKPCGQNTECFWSILTIGGAENMTWRTLDSTITDNSIVASDPIHQSFHSASVRGVVFYWTTTWSKTFVVPNMTFLAVDLHDESYHLVHVPSIFAGKSYWKFIPMVTELYVISIMRDFESSCCKENRFRIWKMSDFRRGEWVEVLTVKMDAELESSLKENFLDVIAWYEKEKVLVFLTPDDEKMGHDFKLGKTNSIIHTCCQNPHRDNFYPHVYSLVRW